MNCKQGDLAYVIKSELGNEGMIVRCIKLHISNGVPAWKTKPKPPQENCFGFIDDFLRPIKNPGDEANDESKAWLPLVPHKEVV